MPFDLIGKHRAKLMEVNVQSLKLGQTELKPALSLRLRVTLPNTSVLPKLDAGLLPFLYERNSAAQTQGTLDGVPVVSDMPQLTAAARRLGTFSWEDEQTGCGLVIYQGVTGDMNIALRDGKRSIQKVDPKEGGTVDVTFDYDVADLDAETIGDIAVLKNHEPDIELTVPVAMQQSLDEEEPNDDDEPEHTPEQALAEALQNEGTQAKAPKLPKKKTPMAKKIARASAKLAKAKA